jgi:hypothetical protein
VIPSDQIESITSLNTMAHATSTLLEVDFRIRTLSTLITNLNKKVETPEFTDHRKTSAALVACNHIAVLLTRGIEDANNRPIGPGRKVVAVTGKLASNLSLAMSVDADEVGPPLATGILTQNPTPKDRPKFKIETVTPSPATLDELAALPCVPSTTLSPLFLSHRNYDCF